MKRMIAVLLILTVLLGMAASAAAAGLGIGTVKGGWLRLRSAPNTLGQVIGRYYTGTKVTVHSSIGAWYYVTAPDGKVGYMSRNYITLNGGGGGVMPGPGGWSGIPSGESGYVTSQNGRGVRLRSSPSSASAGNVIGLYSVGTKLTVLKKGIGWHYIQIGSQTGYMMSQFIVIGGSPVPGPGPSPVVPVVPDTSYTAYITSLNGKGVRLRTGPGVNYSLLGTFPVGTEVTVLKNLGAWCYVRIGKKTGYIMTTFLTTVPPSPTPPAPGPGPGPVTPAGTVEDAQITIQDPIIGDHLYVYVTPTDAEFTVLWYNEAGTLLGTGNGYLVKPADKGHRIRGRVVGRNGWSGTVETLFTDTIGGSGGSSEPPAAKYLSGQVFLPADVSVNDSLTPMIQNCNASAITITWYVDGLKYAQKNAIKVTSEMAGKSVQVVITAAGYQGSITAVTTVKAASTGSSSEPELIIPVGPAAPEIPSEPELIIPVGPSAPVTPSEPELIVPAGSGEPESPSEPELIVPVIVSEPETPAIEPVTPVSPSTPSEPETPQVEYIAPVSEPGSTAAEPSAPAEPDSSAAPLVEFITP